MHWPLFAGLLAMLILTGCGTMSSKSGPGFSPSSADYKRAALAALRDPNTWVPAVGAGVFLATDWDRELSDWARRENPLFGSEASANRASDVLMYTSVGGALASSLWVPKNAARPHRLVVQVGAIAANGVATQVLKYAVGRTRPDNSNDLSFPSGHASAAFNGATLMRRNFVQMNLQPASRTILNVGAISLAVGTAWARVEAGVHYPSDVLAGAALGNFFAAFINDAFLREGALADGAVQVNVTPLESGAVLRLTGRF